MGAGAREHDEIPRREIGVLTKGLAGETLELVAVHGSLRYSTCDGQPEARSGATTFAREHREEAIG